MKIMQKVPKSECLKTMLSSLFDFRQQEKELTQKARFHKINIAQLRRSLHTKTITYFLEERN